MTGDPTFAERVLEATGPAFRDAAGGLLPALVEALTGELAATDQLLTAPADPSADPSATAPLADLDASPFPHWLGQLVGLRVPARLSLDEARAYVTGRGVSRRGTPTALAAAAAGTLTGTRRVDLVERDGSPWRLLLITYAAETPDPAATYAAALTEKPVGLVLVHVAATGQVFGVTTAEGATFGQHTATGRTFADRSRGPVHA